MESICRLFVTTVAFRALVLSASIFFVSEGFAQPQSETHNQELATAIKLIEDRRHSEAISVLKKLTSSNKEDAHIWFYLGLAYSYVNEKEEATKALEQAVRLDPGFDRAHTLLTQTYAYLGKTEAATVSLDRALISQPNNPKLHYLRAFIGYPSDQVIKHADLAIAADPDFAKAYLLKAQAIMNTYSSGMFGVGDEAQKEKQRALYNTAAAPLDKFVQLSPVSDNTRLWTNIVDTMNNFTLDDRKSVLTGKQVSTKARLISKPEPHYTEEARLFSVTGTVVLRVVFASDASVKHVQVIYALRGGLAEEAIRAALRIKFIPATLDGKPVSMWMQLEYNFNLY